MHDSGSVSSLSQYLRLVMTPQSYISDLMYGSCFVTLVMSQTASRDASINIDSGVSQFELNVILSMTASKREPSRRPAPRKAAD